jgi:catechol 2,3-dioxygenase-like lactoylglutathione lyase family enzyme
MKGAALFCLGLISGSALIKIGVAQEQRFERLNHVGMVVENYDEAFDFYTNKMGFREAYTVRNPDGSPLLTYLQLSRETFLELIPATEAAATGITHFGIEVDDIDAKVAELRRRGAVIDDPAMTPANARFARMRDASGLRIEVMEFGPQALQQQAMDAWDQGSR